MRTLDDVIGELPPARQQKVEARAQELIAEEFQIARRQSQHNES